ncbi:MAG TPA: hypothetical protein ENI69_03750 [Rhodospirillales bacterium]|nr:hypothetical protein [Rhodospirillales bacterium]
MEYRLIVIIHWYTNESRNGEVKSIGGAVAVNIFLDKLFVYTQYALGYLCKNPREASAALPSQAFGDR